ncbi:MAG: hypothetical protein ACRCZP_18875, partial [Phycicoccus sp.]
QLPATSDLVASVIGPPTAVALTPVPGRTFNNGEVISDSEIGNCSIRAGATVTFRRCRFVGGGANSYLIRATAGGGLHVILEDCELIQRSGASKGLVMFGDGNVTVKRTIFRGGQDNAFFNPPNSPGVIPTGDSLVPNARVLIEECWFGDLERIPGSHTDCVQVDGGGYMVMRRSRIMSYSIPQGADPQLVRISDPATAELGGGGLIATQNSSSPSQITGLAVRDCWAEGGNNTIDINPSDGLPVVGAAVTGNRFGVRHRFQPLLTNGVRAGNTWGQSGVSARYGEVVAGTPLPGE